MGTVLFVIFLGGASMAAVTLRRRALQERRQIWAEVSASCGGEHIVPRSWFSGEAERIEVIMGRAQITLDTFRTHDLGKNTYTVCRAPFVHGRGPVCRVQPRHLRSSTGMDKVDKGTLDMVLGMDVAFDAHFRVKGDEPAEVQAWFTPEAAMCMYRIFPRATLESDGASLELVELGMYKDPEKMRAAMVVVAMLTNQDVYGVQALRELAGPGFSLDAFSNPRAEVSAPVPVELQPEVVNRTLVTVARLCDRHALDRVSMRLRVDEDGRVEPTGMAGKLPPQAFMYLPRVGSGRLLVDREGARFVWSRVEHDSERLRAGVELLGVLAQSRHQDGIYR